MKDYKVLELPFNMPFSDLDKRQAALTFEWFQKSIPQRLEILFNAARSEQPEIADKLDYSPESLVLLGSWFTKHVHTRDKTKEELEEEESKITNPVHRQIWQLTVTKWIWTMETTSLCWDIGIYFGEVFRAKFESVKWTYFTKPKNSVDVNRPILTGFGSPMNPFRLMMVFAAKIHDKKAGPEELMRLYKVWLGNMKLKE